MTYTEDHTIAQMTDGIILARYVKKMRAREHYQTEAQLETQFIQDLKNRGYEWLSISTSAELYANLRHQIERLNGIVFEDEEWQRFLAEYLDPPRDTKIEATKKVQHHPVHDFIFDSGILKNIKIIDKQDVFNNKLQVTNQIKQGLNRYDVTILVNGLPLVHIELKKRGASLREAFNQIQRYDQESFNQAGSLFKYVQIFIISNGTQTRYFANTTARIKNNFEFTAEWADAENDAITDLEDFTDTFFDNRVFLKLISRYCVFNSNNELMVMRPYQIAATEQILNRLNYAYLNKKMGTRNAGGYIWHTTGSGKTLTSFKVAQLVGKLPFIDKVLFVVDRKDLDYQTQQEYKAYQADSVSGTNDTLALQRNLENDEGKIIVTTIQKLNHFIRGNSTHPVYQQNCVLIFDECHRSQFGQAQKRITKHFKNNYQFGFTGTPIVEENAYGGLTTADIFGECLHKYIITHAIKDKKVLKFRVDYKATLPNYREVEEKIGKEQDPSVLKKDTKERLLHHQRIDAITTDILTIFDLKTHRIDTYTYKKKKHAGFNALFAVDSIRAARLYYDMFKEKQAHIPVEKQLKIALIYSFSENDEVDAIGELSDENFNPEGLDSQDKTFLAKAIGDYNIMFKKNHSLEGAQFQNYYRDLSQSVAKKEVDLLIVVGMFLTGFDAPMLNTLFVDKNLRYHGLIQAFSRTNRILNQLKSFGNVVCYRDLQASTEQAIATFADEKNAEIVLEQSYDDYLNGFKDPLTEKQITGYKEICQKLVEQFPDPTEIHLEKDKIAFVKLFGQFLKAENALKNFEEFQCLKTEAPLIDMGLIQDMTSVYHDIREEANREKENLRYGNTELMDLEFQVDLLASFAIDLEYILELIFQKTKENKTKAEIAIEIKRIIRSSLGERAKEDLLLSFIENTHFERFNALVDVTGAFYQYASKAKEAQIKILIQEENLKPQAEAFMADAIRKGYASANGIALDGILPPLSRRGGAREAKKQKVLEKIQNLAYEFHGI